MRKEKSVLTRRKVPARMGVQSPAIGPKGASRGIFDSRKSYLLIDGENFIHRIEETLKDRKIIRQRRDLKKINYASLFVFAEKATKNYYSTVLRSVSKTHKLFNQTENVRQWQRYWVPYMISQGVHYIKAGYLRAREGKICGWCGRSTDVLIEKGVDVRIAVDMVANAKKGVTYYLVSSDTDLLPAIEVVRKRGAKVVYVGFEGRVIKLIATHVDETIIIKNTHIEQAFWEVNKK